MPYLPAPNIKKLSYKEIIDNIPNEAVKDLTIPKHSYYRIVKKIYKYLQKEMIEQGEPVYIPIIGSIILIKDTPIISESRRENYKRCFVVDWQKQKTSEGKGHTSYFIMPDNFYSFYWYKTPKSLSPLYLFRFYPTKYLFRPTIANACKGIIEAQELLNENFHINTTDS